MTLPQNLPPTVILTPNLTCVCALAGCNDQRQRVLWCSGVIGYSEEEAIEEEVGDGIERA